MDDELAARLPEPLRPLARLAENLWWSWQPEAEALFRDLDPERWDGNPVRLLRHASPARLSRAAADAELVGRIARLDAALGETLARPPSRDGGPVAFFCAEYGLHPSLPIYAGGLGILAGDWLKEASDRALPFVAVGLCYARGYFRQRLDRSGWQHEYWTRERPEELPLRRVLLPGGEPLCVEVALRGRAVTAQIWQVDVGRVPLYLLDTDVAENAPVDRFITAQLYVGDRTIRLMQYALLALGGIRALRALGVAPRAYHLNEGHAALAALELAREAVEGGATLEAALEGARRQIVFTTHTPVEAGNERYGAGELLEVLPDLPAALRTGAEPILRLGRANPDDAAQPFGLTELALRTSRSANAVSARHGEVARAMWRHLWPGRDEAPITHVTNGVHLPTWMAPPMRALLEAHGGDPARIPDEALWAARNTLRAGLVEWVRGRSIADRLQRGEPLSYVEGAASTFDASALTIGFARRVAAYKRLHLLIHDAARALSLLRGPRKLQIVIAGKAHPSDDGAKRLVQTIFGLKNEPGVGTHVAFVEDYDLSVAAHLVAGCDLWVNLPRPPLEASGTSGMKAALNGALNLSVLDGWWCEGYEEGKTGWGIASDPAADAATQDARDAAAFYDLVEHEVLPAFYERDAGGLPRAWLTRVRASLAVAVGRFTTSRMLDEYAARIYG